MGPDPTPTVPVYAEDEEVRGLCDLYSPEPTSCTHVRDLADVLLELGKITDEQYGRLRRELIGKPGMDPTTWLLKEGLVGANDILEAKAKLNGLEFRRITPEEVDKQAFQKLEPGLHQAQQHRPGRGRGRHAARWPPASRRTSSPLKT